jgi:NAD(P)-dependent dehydrogenase (short-subunit alcohol dehydrogenase family)
VTLAEPSPVPTDVGREEDVQQLAAAAVEEFGRIDTRVNNAGVSIFGDIMEVSTEDMHRLFDTVFWGSPMARGPRSPTPGSGTAGARTQARR